MSKDSKKNRHTPPDEPDELAHLDDVVIGRAFRWSAIAVAAIALVIAGVVVFLKRDPPLPAVSQTELTAPALPQSPSEEIPAAPFTDITAEAGITFVHENGAYGDKLLPETMGGGCAFFDFDNDGDPDILFVNSTKWPWKASGQLPTMALYSNDGSGGFSDVTEGSGLDVSFYGMGAAVGDYDNDGLPDVLITAVGGNHLFHNEGSGRFVEVTAAAGVGGSPEDWSSCAAWFDYDNDGNLDLFVGHYVEWSREIDLEVDFKLVGIGRAYGQPMDFGGAFPALYHNDGDGRFTEVTAAAGLHIENPATGVPLAKTLGAAPVDLDDDGWMDLVVANDTVQNLVFHNQRDGTFREVGVPSGIAFDSYGKTRGAMGVDSARYRNDQALGIAIGNFANEMTALYVSQQDPLVFTDEAITEGIGPASRQWLKFGIFFFDYDLDGRLDLLSVNGHLEEEISKIQESQSYAQPAQLFWNAGTTLPSCFTPVSAEKSGADLFKPIVGRGSAFADIDGDGDLDVLLTQVGGKPLLLRNDQALGHHWLRLKLVGAKANRDAIGARVNLRRQGQTQSRDVMPTRGYLSQSELTVTFGLGPSADHEGIEVVWPGGARQTVEMPGTNAMTVVVEGR